jgi:hypothetical protein
MMIHGELKEEPQIISSAGDGQQACGALKLVDENDFGNPFGGPRGSI